MGFEWKRDGHLITFPLIHSLMNGVAARKHPETKWNRKIFPFPFDFYIYLGGSNLIASNSDIDFFLKHGAKSSSSKSPWQPVSAATFFFTESGSRWSAHGESAEPLINIARWIKSGRVTHKGEKERKLLNKLKMSPAWIDEKFGIRNFSSEKACRHKKLWIRHCHNIGNY